MPVGGWGRAVENGSATLPAAVGVVPCGGDAWKASLGHLRASQDFGDDVRVEEHPVSAEWMGAGEAELVEELPAEGWLQWRWPRAH